MIRVICLANQVARAPVTRHVHRRVFFEGRRGRTTAVARSRTSPPQQLQQQQQWTLKPAARDFSSRGGRGTSRSWQQQQQQEQLERTRRFQQQQEQQQTWKPSRRSVVVGSVAGASALIFVANQDDAPYTHRRRFMVVSRDGEFLKGISKKEWDSVKRQYAANTLPKSHPATQTVERVGRRIAEASGLEGCKWEFIVVKEDTMNAFVLPGGKVVVFTGLLGATPNEDALASILGHEVGHVVANHAGEKLSKSYLKEGLLLLFFAATGSGFEYFDVARGIGSLVFDLPNSREMEREADFIGLQLMSKACYDPHEMPETFRRMEAMAKQKGIKKGSAYLSTHPADDERIAKQNEWMDNAIQTRERSNCGHLKEWGGLL